MIELAVFDMAGTTIDDGGAVYDSLAAVVTAAGATLDPADLQTWMGTDKVEAITALLQLGGVTPTDALVASSFASFKETLAASYLSNPPVAFPGVADALASLRARGIKVALTTGFDEAVVGPLLASLGWTVADAHSEIKDPNATVDAVVTTSDVAAGRPAPYMIHRAMERTGVHSVSAVLAAGDTLVDLQAARNAGAVAVGVLTGALDEEGLSRGPYDYIVGGVVDIPALPECQPGA